MSPEQLEVKCVADEAWYNADVEILDDGILVRYDGFNEDDEVWDIAYLRKHAGNVQDVIRLSSSQLQDEQCLSIKEGMVVCARAVLENNDDDDDDEEDGEKEEEVKYFDARIVNVARNPHTFDDEEERCTCVFEAYWITGPHKKKFANPYNSVFFTCEDICLLNNGHVESHPVVQKLLHLVGISSQVLSDQSEKSHPRSSLTGPSRSREVSSNEDRPLASEQSGNPDFHVKIAESVLIKEASTTAERETSCGGISEQSRKSASAFTAAGIEAEGESDQEDNISVISISSDDFSTSAPSWAESGDTQSVELKVGPVPEQTVKIEGKNVDEKVMNLSPEGAITRPPLKRMRGSVDEYPAWFKPSGRSQIHLQPQ